MWPYMGSMGWWMALWWVLGIAVLILLVRLAVGWTDWPASRNDDTPEQILKRRYAKGEIDREEYWSSQDLVETPSVRLVSRFKLLRT